MWHDSYFIVPAVPLAAAALYAVWTRHHIGRFRFAKSLPGRGLPLLDAAFLAGGEGRVFDTALLRMHLTERAVVSRSGLVTLTGAKPYDAVDRAIRDAVGPTGSREIAPLRYAVKRSAAVLDISHRLEAQALVYPFAWRWRVSVARRRLLLALLLVAASAVAAELLDDGAAGHDRPNLWVPGLLAAGGLVTMLAAWPSKKRITPAGRRQLSLLRNTPWTPEHGVPPQSAGGALLGALALAGPAAAGLENPELEAAMLAAAAQEATVRHATAAGTAASSASGSPSSSPSSSSSSSSSSCSSGSSGFSGCGSSSCGSSHSSGCGSSHSSGCGSSCGSGCGGGS
ncbi:TIGR04222 domain-containing membrane protein [Kitasatospora sp. NPDC101235]|uniref:TIGR04222 domain-containing membrane protein n=1 Tax=Kitasatospora sp. NPDC101235 TaxID=3364101 RepID=UPI003804F520